MTVLGRMGDEVEAEADTATEGEAETEELDDRKECPARLRNPSGKQITLKPREGWKFLMEAVRR